MKILSLLMMSLFLHAQNIEIQVAKDLEIGWDEEFDSVEFVYKSDLGRAAVEVTFAEDDGEGYWYRTERVLIDGLTFNQEKKAVVYNSVVCAEVKKRFKVFSSL